MNGFDQRWQSLAAKARRALPETFADEALPLGFTTRVLARWREAPQETWVDLMNAFGLRAAAVIALTFAGSAGFAVAEWYEFRIELPAVESVVTSELPWP